MKKFIGEKEMRLLSGVPLFFFYHLEQQGEFPQRIRASKSGTIKWDRAQVEQWQADNPGRLPFIPGFFSATK